MHRRHHRGSCVVHTVTRRACTLIRIPILYIICTYVYTTIHHIYYYTCSAFTTRRLVFSHARLEIRLNKLPGLNDCIYSRRIYLSTCTYLVFVYYVFISTFRVNGKKIISNVCIMFFSSHTYNIQCLIIVEVFFPCIDDGIL